MPLRIDQPVDPCAAAMPNRIVISLPSAPPGDVPALAMQMRTIRVGYDQAGVGLEISRTAGSA